MLIKHLDDLHLIWDREWRFHPERQWRFDFRIFCTATVNDPTASRQVGIEIEGGIWTNGRHTRGAGFERDLRKYNEAARLGWTVIRFTPNMIERGESKAFLAELFGAK